MLPTSNTTDSPTIIPHAGCMKRKRRVGRCECDRDVGGVGKYCLKGSAPRLKPRHVRKNRKTPGKPRRLDRRKGLKRYLLKKYVHAPTRVYAISIYPCSRLRPTYNINPCIFHLLFNLIC